MTEPKRTPWLLIGLSEFADAVGFVILGVSCEALYRLFIWFGVAHSGIELLPLFGSLGVALIVVLLRFPRVYLQLRRGSKER